MAGPTKAIRERLKSLEEHLEQENPLLVEVVDGYRQLSKVGYAMGLLAPSESYATQISWWPLISVLGTFSAGKSTFINHYLGYPLQDTGNQAVDDKFTVICYGSDEEVRVLPGLALDADPRFPFYQTSEALERVAPGEGKRIDAYLQLKTCRCEKLKGRIFIDSPGFDADAQRSAILRLTNHIIDLSDLVLVFFDARHPEPGAMSDTLAHLVRDTIDRSDSSKFLYILNQIDTTAREDNPEEVVGAWQRALAREGLTAGRFYCIYNPEAAIPIENEALRRRFEWKRDQDMGEIYSRIEQVSIERAYRIVGNLEKRAQEIEEYYVPRLRELIARWRRNVLQGDALVMLLVLLGMLGVFFADRSLWSNISGAVSSLLDKPWGIVALAAGIGVAGMAVHFSLRHWVANRIVRQLRERLDVEEADRQIRAFRRNTRFWRSIFETEPAGWTTWNRRRLRRIIDRADQFVQKLNDRFTDPSGRKPVGERGDAEAPAGGEGQGPEGEKVVTGEVITSLR
ncbi:MAG TPA: dynamin family protein [Thiotrichales bacterium]|nr:dynamin family protein [Thiotrichales bacterium]